ncbi:MAG: hypothetical protein RIA69_15840 [Cyclobacteriaceae bacterium]
MNPIIPDIQNLIDKLIIAEEVYHKASSKAHDQAMTNQIKMLAARKEMLLEDITKLLTLEMENYKVKWKNRVKAEMEKIGIELDHIYLRLNQGSILSFCIKREEELIEMYKQALNEKNHQQIGALVRDVLLYQMNESTQLLAELKDKKESYNFSDNA